MNGQIDRQALQVSHLVCSLEGQRCSEAWCRGAPNTDHLKERGVEKGSGLYSTFQGRERSVLNQTNIGTVSRATLGRLLRDGAERVWAFPSATMPCSAETETETATVSVYTLICELGLWQFLSVRSLLAMKYELSSASCLTF